MAINFRPEIARLPILTTCEGAVEGMVSTELAPLFSTLPVKAASPSVRGELELSTTSVAPVSSRKRRGRSSCPLI